MMSTEKKPAKRIYTLATAIGLALGTMGVAAAATSPADTPAVVIQTQTNAPNQATAPDNEADEAEAPGDEDVDGVDHQFEGEEIGNNGDGIPDADDANEAAEATTGG